MKNRSKQKLFQVLFNLSMIIKGIDGLFELAGGLAFIFLKKEHLLNLISKISHYNVLNISNHTFHKLANAASKVFETDIKNFIIVVLVCNGFIKIVIAGSLFLRIKRAFPYALVFLFALLVYQVVQMFYSPSLFLWLFNAFDALVILVIWAEYEHLKKTRKLH